MKLHNLCIEDGMPNLEPIARGREKKVRKRDRFRPYNQSNDGLMFRLTTTERSNKNRTNNTSRRDQLHERVNFKGLRRPQTSKHGLGQKQVKDKARLKG